MSGFLNIIRNGDIFILSIVNNTIKCRLLDWFMPKVTYLASTNFVVSLCIALFIYPDKYIHKFSIKFSLSIIISTVIAWIFKLMFNRTRPYLKINNLNVNKISVDDYSFPSAHSATSFSMGIAASIFFPQLSIYFIALASFIAISRIYIGVHYPTDVLTGVIIGILSSLYI